MGRTLVIWNKLPREREEINLQAGGKLRVSVCNFSRNRIRFSRAPLAGATKVGRDKRANSEQL